METIEYVKLGGTLFIPASHKAVEAIVLEEKYPQLRSLVIDTEDGLDAADLSESLSRIERILQKLNSSKLLLFLRPRNPKVLAAFLKMEGIEKVNGFVLPKFSLTNAASYLVLLEKTEHSFMPSIEGEELFDTQKLVALKELLLKYKKRIVLVRFGLEDMLRLLLLRRSCEESVFDICAAHVALGNFIGIFKSAGFGVSGGVYPCYKNAEGFVKDTARDLREGLFSKTIIHPNQIALINECYKVSKNEYEEALAIVNAKSALFALDDKMAEKSTMYAHSLMILKRKEYYGVLKNGS